MNDKKALSIADKIYKMVFDRRCEISLDELLEKYAFDIDLPKEVRDSITNEITWADSISSASFITLDNMEKKDNEEGWMKPREDISSLDDIIRLWKNINLTTTERVYDSINVSKSDTIYSCENIYRSTDMNSCKNAIYSNSCVNSEYIIGSNRSTGCNFCIRTDDSKDCSNSYSVVCSNKISNSLFIQDSFNLHECMFCAHIANQRFCIANMQFEEEEYYELKKLIIEWLISS